MCTVMKTNVDITLLLSLPNIYSIYIYLVGNQSFAKVKVISG